jgi:hypothetical protein
LPLIYQTKKNTYIKSLLSREKGISEERKEGRKAASKGWIFRMLACRRGRGFIFEKKPLKHIYYLLGYKVNPRLSFFFIIPSFIHSLAANKIM